MPVRTLSPAANGDDQSADLGAVLPCWPTWQARDGRPSRTAYLEGRSIAALAREHSVSRGAIRTAVADLLPEHVATDESAPAPELPVTLNMPGKVADFLRASELDDAERTSLDHGQAVRRGTGYTLRVTAVPAIHRQLLDRCQVLDDAGAIPTQRKARREYANRVNDLGAETA